MKAVLIDWKSFGNEDFKETMARMGHSVISYFHENYQSRVSDVFFKDFTEFLKKNPCDFVFSFNYFPSVSRVCKELSVPYVAWVYDMPYQALYSYTLINDCNYVFIFDSETYSELKNGGINTVYYMPLAVNANRLDRMTVTHDIKSRLAGDISFVGSMYDEKHTLYTDIDKADAYTRGYIEGLIRAQSKVYGCSFIRDCLNSKILGELSRVHPINPTPDGIESPEYVYSSYFIERKLTSIERKKLLTDLSEKFSLKLYTHNPVPYMPKALYMGPVDYYDVMPYIFKCSKINLNLTLRSIHAGIPLRAMDIMGAGGFLLTNYQPDFLDFYESDRDYVYYEDEADLMDKCRFYLEHDAARLEIAQNGYLKTKAEHNYETALGKIFDIAGLK